MPAICTPFHPLASSCLNTFLQKLFVFLPLLQLCIPLSLTVFLLHNCASRLSSVLSATLLCKPWVRGSLPWYEASCFRHIDPGKLLSYAAALHRTVQNTVCMDTVSIYRLYIYRQSYHVPLGYQPGVGDTGSSTAVCFRVWS